METAGTCAEMLRIIRSFSESGGCIERSLSAAGSLRHIMTYSDQRALASLFALISENCMNILRYDAEHPDFPLATDRIERYLRGRIHYQLFGLLPRLRTCREARIALTVHELFQLEIPLKPPRIADRLRYNSTLVCLASMARYRPKT
ncbi:hypothetical protein MRB53_039585 [Persea americana]|nr:hypothetical protein MRB53_039585 [Persea americana]